MASKREMSEGKDPAIKLFGKTIPLPECHAPFKSDEKSDLGSQIPMSSQVLDVCSEIMKTETEDLRLEESGKQEKSDAKDNQITANETEVQVNLKRKENLAETSSVDQDKVLKKPDKVLPCPRCNSFDTKFCYFNNYNVNQPRHFCKNCQRYWTAGGTMRNVPIGAGRRKNKQLAFQYRQMLVPEPAARTGISDSGSQQLFPSSESPRTLRPSASSGTVLKFGSEGRLCESMETVLQLRDQKNCAPDLGSIGEGSMRENRQEPPSCTSSIAENQIPEKASFPGSSNELTQQNRLQFCSVPPWVFPCNQFWNNGTSIVTAPSSSEGSCIPDGSKANPIQWCSTPMLTVPGFSAPTIPLHFLPSSYWGCYPVWTAGTRNLPMVGSNGGFSMSSSSSSSSTVNIVSSTNSPTLGKHLRDANLMNEERSEKCILVPKTLRIDEPDEASKSSIWTALGFDSNRKETEVSCGGGGALKPFRSSGECKGNASDATQVLEANPAALSRSHTFQESA